NAIISLTYDALNTREKKTKYHNRLMKLLKASLRYREKDADSETDYNNHIAGLTHPLEKRYMLDLAAMAVWEDRITEPSEMAFMHRLCNDLKLPPEAAGNAIANVNDFYERHKDELPYLNDGNFARNFYDNASKMVSTLIIRNKKRLQQELMESKELVMLLSQATSRELSKAEKQKVKAQLTDIFKMIP
ncbi:MAG: hypothetical protein KDD04_12880, partial [Sinomicrobium sp.]|nr:hypothetical protein [Sinomicrobium sp.]